jgi:hypothetical protein
MSCCKLAQRKVAERYFCKDITFGKDCIITACLSLVVVIHQIATYRKEEMVFLLDCLYSLLV